MFENVISDINVYNKECQNIGLLKRCVYILFRYELWGVLIYRFGRWANYECGIPIVKFGFRLIYFFLRKISDIIFDIGIWPESEIGYGLNVHNSGIYIKAKIGKNCVISQQVTIGHVGGFKGGGVPALGDNVYIGAGAKILGEVKIGNNVIIGANAVVISDIPDNAIAVGIPAKVVKIRE